MMTCPFRHFLVWVCLVYEYDWKFGPGIEKYPDGIVDCFEITLRWEVTAGYKNSIPRNIIFF